MAALVMMFVMMRCDCQSELKEVNILTFSFVNFLCGDLGLLGFLRIFSVLVDSWCSAG